MPRPLLTLRARAVPDRLPPGPLATTRLDEELIRRGLIIAAGAEAADEEEEEDDDDEEERPPTLAEKLRLLFDALYPDVTDVNTQVGLGGGRAAALRRQLQPVRRSRATWSSRRASSSAICCG